MNKFKINYKWSSIGTGKPEYANTMATMSILVDNTNLVKNIDTWSKTIQDDALFSAYHLAIWFASSWWRLNWEHLPLTAKINTDWRMSHEIGAANHGFIWPKIIFASDGDAMQIWAISTPSEAEEDSISYINGLNSPAYIKLQEFQSEVDSFINNVISRLHAVNCTGTDLENIWTLVQEDRNIATSTQYRCIEAQLGYDPDECPTQVIKNAIDLGQKIGAGTLAELIPIYGSTYSDHKLEEIEQITNESGITGTPNIPQIQTNIFHINEIPWKSAVSAANEMRKAISKTNESIDDKDLYELLGISTKFNEKINTRHIVGLAKPEGDSFKYFPRKQHPIAQRFEFSRFIGDIIFSRNSEFKHSWLASTELRTHRQKFQRAFAAAFLCPLDSLLEQLQNDFSEDSIKIAADKFEVSELTVTAILQNNHITNQMDYGYEDRAPYSI